MATKVSQLRTANKAGNTSREYVLLSNIDTGSSSKLALNDVLPTLQSGKTSGAVTEGTAGTTVQDLFVGGGVGSSIANSDKSILIFKGLNVEDANGALKIRTDVSTSDSNKKNVVIELSQSSIDLSVASNTTSKFLSATGGSNVLTLSDTTHYTGDLPVEAGGTGVSTLTDGGILLGNGTGAVQATASLTKGSLLVGTSSADPAEHVIGGALDGYALVVDSTATNGIKWGKPQISTLSLTSDLDTNNNSIDIGSGWLTATGSTSGLRLNTSTDYIYIGQSTPYFSLSLNVQGGVELGSSNGNSAESIVARTCSVGASPALSLQASDNADSSTGGDLNLKGGAGDAAAAGGNVNIEGGLKGSSGTDDGEVRIKTGGTTALTVDKDQDVNVTAGSLIAPARFGYKVSGGAGATQVTQTTSLSTGVTLNGTAGKITLYSGSVAAGLERDFVFTNVSITANSIIMLSVEVGAAATTGATLCALAHTVTAGSCTIRLSNPGSAPTTGSEVIHFFVIDVTA